MIVSFAFGRVLASRDRALILANPVRVGSMRCGEDRLACGCRARAGRP